MPTSLVEKIAKDLSTQIEEGALATGTRLASIRSAAVELGVSKNTVAEAYERLVATGHIRSRRGSGFYVAQLNLSYPRVQPEHFTEAIDQISLLREQLNQVYTVRAGDGRLPASWMETSELYRHFRRNNQHDDGSDDFEYGRPQGFTPLRETIARTLVERSIYAGTEQVLLTFGANHSLDLIIRHFVDAGDAVLVETPGYYPLFGKLHLAKANIVGIPRGPDGPDLEAIEKQARIHHPRLMYIQPMAHNPTGTSMSLPAMHRLLQIAERHNITVIEDDPFADIMPRTTPHLASLDALNRVIYLGTFSKTLSASLRCGFIAAASELVAPLTDIKMLTVVTTSGTTERMIHDLIVKGRYRRHLVRLMDRVAQASADACASLEGIGIKGIHCPTGGYYLWCPLPEHIDDIELAKRASQEGIFLAPGSLFSKSETPQSPALRVNIAHASDPRLLSFLKDNL